MNDHASIDIIGLTMGGDAMIMITDLGLDDHLTAMDDIENIIPQAIDGLPDGLPGVILIAVKTSLGIWHGIRTDKNYDFLGFVDLLAQPPGGLSNHQLGHFLFSQQKMLEIACRANEENSDISPDRVLH